MVLVFVALKINQINLCLSVCLTAAALRSY
jgi:hypothetical protein